MYKGVQKRFWAIVATLLLGCMLIACGDSADSGTTNKTETDSEVSETVGSQSIPDGTSEESADATDCPEGYVYDYQVSMEPIPEEIAALGGPCQGTIHAYPSRIAMALTELQMEEDPVLKAEVEKRIPEIEAAFEEEIGGDFVVDGVILQDELSWMFICTEVATGYQFCLPYANQEYYAQLNNTWSIANVISVNDYYKEQENIILQDELLPCIAEYYSEGDIKVNSQLDVNMTDILIVQYTDEQVDKYLEQEKILMLWENLKKYNDTLSYNICFIYYPYEYKHLVEEKFSTSVRYDFWTMGVEEVSSPLIENNEMWNCMYYAERRFAEDENNLNELLQQYQTGTYDNTVAWDYWVE